MHNVHTYAVQTIDGCACGALLSLLSIMIPHVHVQKQSLNTGYLSNSSRLASFIDS